MNKLKLLFQQTILLSTAILFVIGVEGLAAHFIGWDFELDWYYPACIIFTGFLCSLLTVLIFRDEYTSKRRFIFHVILHCLSEFVVVSVAGFWFHWYDSLSKYWILVIQYFTVYFFAWAATLWVRKVDENRINEVLKKIQDDE